MYCPHDVPLPLLQALEDLVDAVGEVKALQERNAEADRNAQIEVSAQVLPVPSTFTLALVRFKQTAGTQPVISAQLGFCLPVTHCVYFLVKSAHPCSLQRLAAIPRSAVPKQSYSSFCMKAALRFTTLWPHKR